MEFIGAKTILQRATCSDEWFGIDYNMNLYKGYCHKCIYCDSRSNCYNIEDFDRVRCKKADVILKFTITSADENLSRKIEPNVCVSSERLKAMHQLSNQGIFFGILLSPLIPFITDSVENIKIS